MIYLQATLRVPLENREEFIKTLIEEYIPAREKYGMKMVGAWETMIGLRLPREITHLWSFEDLGHMQRCLAVETEEVAKAKTRVLSFAVDESLKILGPLPYSPLK